MDLNFDYKIKTSFGKEALDCLIVFHPEVKESTTEHKARTNNLAYLSSAIKSSIEQCIKLKVFQGKANQTQILMPSEGETARVLLVGLGDSAKVDAEVLRKAAGKSGKVLVEMKLKSVALTVPPLHKNELPVDLGVHLAEGLVLGSYEFNLYKTSRTKKNTVKTRIGFYDTHKSIKSDDLKRGALRAEATNFTRTLGNTPANDMTPTTLVKHAQLLAKEYALKCHVLDQKDMEKLGMGMFLGVSQGAVEPPKMIFLEYHHKDAKKTLAIVGKGVTFDSGGISLKPGANMDEMKFDMCGAAAVMGTMRAIGQLKPKCNVIGVMPATENMPSGTAQRPGDIVTSLAGKKVEILNTDAEGRLILGDALTYTAKTYKPHAMIDLATLTGACIIALGHYASGAITNDESLVQKVIDAGKKSGERVWSMPNYSEYEEALKGKYADLQNIGGRDAGVITAGLFLKNFVENVPWVHLDIAGTAWGVRGVDYIPNEGATGVGVRLLLDFIESWLHA